MYFGQEEPPKAFLQDRINKTKQSKSPPIVLKPSTKVDMGREYKLADFDKNDSIDSNKQEGTKTEYQAFLYLKLQLCQFINFVRNQAFLN